MRATPWKRAVSEQVLDHIGEPPAYVKRAARLERAVEALHARAERHYRSLTRFVELRRKELAAALARKKERAQRRLDETVDRCNARWRKWLEADGRYDAVNRQIDDFNRYYNLERQAALKHVPMSFVRADPKDHLGPEDLLQRYRLMST